MSETTAPAQPAPRQATPAPRSWVAPLVASLITLPLMGLAYFSAVFSSMACDACSSAEAGPFESSYEVAFLLLQFGLFVPAGMLVTSWSMPAQRRYEAKRALVAFLAPVVVVFEFLLFMALVDWP
ncbi:hypothetical protein [Streptomyces sp. NPDC059009]|uniref:hypothetical protein n=1 Tax=Streptomyces sp. NPDC059009 TaxID=3346694 RepID=UPI0036AFD74C